MRIHAILVTLWLVPAIHAQITGVDWGAQISNGLGKADGTELPAGDLIRIGTFSLSDSQIRDNGSNLALLNAAFTQYDTAFIGDDVGVPAHWNKLTTKATVPLGLNGHKIYLWAFDAPSMANASQQGIFTSGNPNWIFPADDAIPNTTTIDLQEVQAASILVGGYGVGTSTATGAALFNLALVPEPEGWTLGTGAVLVLFALIARRRSAILSA